MRAGCVVSQVGGSGGGSGHGSVHPSAAAGHKDGERRRGRDDQAISGACCPRWLVEHNSWCHKPNQSSRYNQIFSIYPPNQPQPPSSSATFTSRISNLLISILLSILLLVLLRLLILRAFSILSCFTLFFTQCHCWGVKVSVLRLPGTGNTKTAHSDIHSSESSSSSFWERRSLLLAEMMDTLTSVEIRQNPAQTFMDYVDFLTVGRRQSRTWWDQTKITLSKKAKLQKNRMRLSRAHLM